MQDLLEVPQRDNPELDEVHHVVVQEDADELLQKALLMKGVTGDFTVRKFIQNADSWAAIVETNEGSLVAVDSQLN